MSSAQGNTTQLTLSMTTYMLFQQGHRIIFHYLHVIENLKNTKKKVSKVISLVISLHDKI